MTYFILLIGFLVASCNKKDDSSSSTTKLNDKIQGTWKQESSTCDSTVYTPKLVTNTISFSGGTYTIVNDATGCKATRTGTFSAIDPNTLSLSFNTASCSPSTCSADYFVNSTPKKLNCPSGMTTDGQNFAVSVDASTMYLTPTSGQDLNCFHKYTKQ